MLIVILESAIDPLFVVAVMIPALARELKVTPVKVIVPLAEAVAVSEPLIVTLLTITLAAVFAYADADNALFAVLTVNVCVAGPASNVLYTVDPEFEVTRSVVPFTVETAPDKLPNTAVDCAEFNVKFPETSALDTVIPF